MWVSVVWALESRGTGMEGRGRPRGREGDITRSCKATCSYICSAALLCSSCVDVVDIDSARLPMPTALCS